MEVRDIEAGLLVSNVPPVRFSVLLCAMALVAVLAASFGSEFRAARTFGLLPPVAVHDVLRYRGSGGLDIVFSDVLGTRVTYNSPMLLLGMGESIPEPDPQQMKRHAAARYLSAKWLRRAFSERKLEELQASLDPFNKPAREVMAIRLMDFFNLVAPYEP